MENQYPDEILKFLQRSRMNVSIYKVDDAVSFEDAEPPVAAPRMSIELYSLLEKWVNQPRSPKSLEKVQWAGRLPYYTTKFNVAEVLTQGRNECVAWTPPDITEICERVSSGSQVVLDDFKALRNRHGEKICGGYWLAGADPVKGLASMMSLGMYKKDHDFCITMAMAGFFGLAKQGREYYICGYCLNGLDAGQDYSGGKKEVPMIRAILLHHFLTKEKCFGDFEQEPGTILGYLAGLKDTGNRLANSIPATKVDSELVKCHLVDCERDSVIEEENPRLLITRNYQRASITIDAQLCNQLKRVQRRRDVAPILKYIQGRERAYSLSQNPFRKGVLNEHRESHVRNAAGMSTSGTNGLSYDGYFVPDPAEANKEVNPFAYSSPFS